MATEIDEARWLELTEATIRITEGKLDLASKVAERCRDAQPSPAGLRILATLLGHGDIWEQHHVDSIGVEAVRSALDHGLVGEAVEQLRERLIQRGRHDVGPTDQKGGT